NTRAALDTQQHATQQNKRKHKHALLKPLQPTRLKDRKNLCFINSQNHTHEMRAIPVFTCKQKLATPGAQTRHQTMTKTCHHQVLTSTQATKQILYSP
ncbi:hypothetical protein, partial [Corynebacterium matruchotii]|uniref:hypothetical protein n=1 Tax=Corynebacterium matruchotii TaxID=43768 RepID=UPI001C49B9F6